MALAARIVGLGVLVQGIFRISEGIFKRCSFPAPCSVRQVATDAGHLATRKRIGISAHGMTRVGVSMRFSLVSVIVGI